MSAGAIFAGAVAASGVILGAAAREAADTGPDYIRDGQPEGIVKRLGLGIARAACRRYAENPSVISDENLPLYETACRPYLTNLGYGVGPELEKPFDGGQCATTYRLRGTYVQSCGPNAGQTATWVSNGNVTGPVAGSIAKNASGAGWNFVPSDGSTPRQLTSDLTGGSVIVVPRPGILCTTISSGSRPSAAEVAPVLVSVERLDGLPDNCGDPSPVYKPPVAPVPTPNPEPFNPGPDIDVNLNVVLVAPGAIVVNIGLGTGPITIDPFADGDGSGDGGVRPPGDIGEPAAPVDVGEGDDVDGEAPDGSVIGALLLEITNNPPSHKLVAPGVYRGACYAYLGTATGLDLDPAGGLLRTQQVIFPELENLTHWRVQANRGFTIRVTPYYVDTTTV